MSQFEFLFVLFALIMGLSMVELLQGLGRGLQLKLAPLEGAEPMHFGWLTPMMALFVILDLLSFWIFAWVIRDMVEVGRFAVLAVVAFAGFYFLAARLVFPNEAAQYRDLDVYFFKMRKTILGMLGTMVVIQWIYILCEPRLFKVAVNSTNVIVTLSLFALLAGAAFARSRRWATIMMGLLIARYVVLFVI